MRNVAILVILNCIILKSINSIISQNSQRQSKYCQCQCVLSNLVYFMQTTQKSLDFFIKYYLYIPKNYQLILIIPIYHLKIFYKFFQYFTQQKYINHTFNKYISMKKPKIKQISNRRQVEALSPTRKLIKNLQEHLQQRSRSNIVKKQSNILNKLEEQFDGKDLRQTFRSTGIPRYQPNYQIKKQSLDNQTKKSSKKRIIYNNDEYRQNKLWQEYHNKITHPSINDRVQKQRISLYKQCLLEIYKKPYQQIKQLHKIQKQLLLQIYTPSSLYQLTTQEQIVMKINQLQKQIDVLDDRLAILYKQIRYLLNGIFKNGYYMDDGLGSIIEIMAYSDRYLVQYCKQCQQIIDGINSPQTKNKKTEQIIRNLQKIHKNNQNRQQQYKAYIPIKIQPRKQDYPEILDKKSQQYLIKLYEIYYENKCNNIDKLLEGNSKRYSLMEFLNLSKTNSKQQKVKKYQYRKLGKIGKNRVDVNSRLGNWNDNFIKNTSVPIDQQEQQDEIGQKYNINKSLGISEIGKNSQSSNNPQNHQLIRQTNISMLSNKTKFKNKDDVSMFYNSLKSTLIPDIYTISRISDKQSQLQTEAGASQIISKRYNQEQDRGKSYNILLDKIQKQQNRYSIIGSKSSIDSIGKQYKKRISLPIINSQVKVYIPKKIKNNQQMRNKSMFSIQNKSENQYKQRQNKIAQKRRIKNAYHKQLYPKVYRLLFGPDYI